MRGRCSCCVQRRANRCGQRMSLVLAITGNHALTLSYVTLGIHYGDAQSIALIREVQDKMSVDQLREVCSFRLRLNLAENI
jgi:hypothetical protein